MVTISDKNANDLSFVVGRAKKEITLSSPNEREIVIEEGSSILVDPEEGIGFAASSYFEIFPEEYTILCS